MKIGIYPGAFDPVHDGHLAFAEAAIAQFGLDRVYFLPEPTPRHKQGVKALEHRTRMVQLAISDNPQLGVIVLDQNRFTILDTWPRITARFKNAQLFMLLGSDVAQRLASWPHFEVLIETAPTFIIALRSQTKIQVTDMLQTMQHTTRLPLDYHVLDPNYPTFSSRAVRAEIKAGVVPMSVMPEVLHYITKHGLYAAS